MDASSNSSIPSSDSSSSSSSEVHDSQLQSDSSNSLPSESNLYIRNVPVTWSKEYLDSVFSQYGPLVSSRILTDASQISRGIAFVRFKTNSDAQLAMQALQGWSEGSGKGLLIQIARSVPSAPTRHPDSYDSSFESPEGRDPTNLYIVDLPLFVNEDHLRALFSEFGHLTSVAVLRDNDTQQSRGIGFCRFATHDEAKNALKALQGHMVDGATKPMKIRYSRKGRRGEDEQANDPNAAMWGPPHAFGHPPHDPHAFHASQHGQHHSHHPHYPPPMPYPYPPYPYPPPPHSAYPNPHYPIHQHHHQPYPYPTPHNYPPNSAMPPAPSSAAPAASNSSSAVAPSQPPSTPPANSKSSSTSSSSVSASQTPSASSQGSPSANSKSGVSGVNSQGHSNPYPYYPGQHPYPGVAPPFPPPHMLHYPPYPPPAAYPHGTHHSHQHPQHSAAATTHASSVASNNNGSSSSSYGKASKPKHRR